MKAVTKTTEHVYTTAGRQRAVYEMPGSEYMIVRVECSEPNALPTGTKLHYSYAPREIIEGTGQMNGVFDDDVEVGKEYVTSATAVGLKIGPFDAYAADAMGHVTMIVKHA